MCQDENVSGRTSLYNAAAARARSQVSRVGSFSNYDSSVFVSKSYQSIS